MTLIPDIGEATQITPRTRKRDVIDVNPPEVTPTQPFGVCCDAQPCLTGGECGPAAAMVARFRETGQGLRKLPPTLA